MSRLTSSMVSTWKMTWLRAGASMMSTGSSVSDRMRISSMYERAGTTRLVSSTGSRIWSVLTAMR